MRMILAKLAPQPHAMVITLLRPSQFLILLLYSPQEPADPRPPRDDTVLCGGSIQCTHNARRIIISQSGRLLSGKVNKDLNPKAKARTKEHNLSWRTTKS